MNILIITDLYPPVYEGNYELRCKETVQGLCDLGHNVSVLTTTGSGTKHQHKENIYRLLGCGDWQEESRGLKYIGTLIKRAITFRKNYWITKKVIRQESPDIIYLWQMYQISLQPLVAIMDGGKPYVFDVADYSLIDWKKFYDSKLGVIKRVIRYLYTGIWNLNNIKSDYIRHITSFMEQEYKQAGIWDKSNTVIPCSIRNLKTEYQCHNNEKRKDDKKIKLLYAGRVVPYKGVHIAIKAIKELVHTQQSKEFVLDIIGFEEKSYVDELKQLVISENLQSNVTIQGMLQREELMEKYKEYHVVLVPSLWAEPFGVVILEAMNAGVPVVASNVGGIPSIIEDSVTGMLVSPGDPLAIVQAVQRLIEDKKLSETIKKNARQKLSDEFDDHKVVKRIEGYLQSILETV